MRHAKIVPLLVSAVLGCAAAQSQEEAVAPPIHSSEVGALCRQLEEIEPGEERQVTLSGIYMSGFEGSVLYDPTEPLCRLDVQPSTAVRFAASCLNNPELRGLLNKDHRAFVTFSGVLHGPQRLRPDDPSVSPYTALVSRIGERGYGHLGRFRTELEVNSILDVGVVPKSTPWNGVWDRPQSETANLVVQKAAMPKYPQLIQRAGLSGEVVLEITIKAGKVFAAKVREGDRLLATEAVSNVETWEFDSETDAVVTARFIYALEKREIGTDESPRLEIHLPYLVKISAPTFDW